MTNQHGVQNYSKCQVFGFSRYLLIIKVRNKKCFPNIMQNLFKINYRIFRFYFLLESVIFLLENVNLRFFNCTDYHLIAFFNQRPVNTKTSEF